MSITLRLRLCITGLVLLVSVSILAFIYINAQRALHQQVQSRVVEAANLISLQIDPLVLDSLRTADDKRSTAYSQLISLLLRITYENDGITRITSMRRDNGGSWIYVLDSAIGESSHGIATRVDPSDERMIEKITSSRPSREYSTTTPELVSGFSIIHDTLGRPCGVVKVEMSLDRLTTQMRFIRNVGLWCLLAAVFLSVALSNALAKLLVSPMNSFVARLRLVSSGDMDTLMDDNRTDEIGEISKTFNEMIQALKSQGDIIRQINSDYLTGLHNHRHFQQQLHDLLSSSNASLQEHALIIIDIDRFKLINDSLGHLTGDYFLREVSAAISSVVSEKHSVARYGGEEFAVILPDTGLLEASELATRICNAVSEHTFEVPETLIDEHGHHAVSSICITISVGVAVYPHHSAEPEGLIMAADIALYRAKHTGRNRVCTYNYDGNTDQIDPYHVYTFIKDPSKSALEALAAAVDARDHYTKNHSDNVGNYAFMIGSRLGIATDDTDIYRMAGLLHDVGKIGVPDYVLNKPDTLTKEEMDIVKSHPSVGESIVRNSQNLDSILPAILYHHERYDGTGYPFGLKGDAIPLIARVIAVADTYDALTTNRPYRKGFTAEEAIQVLEKGKGTQLDPQIVDTFIDCIRSDALSLLAA